MFVISIFIILISVVKKSQMSLVHRIKISNSRAWHSSHFSGPCGSSPRFRSRVSPPAVSGGLQVRSPAGSVGVLSGDQVSCVILWDFSLFGTIFHQFYLILWTSVEVRSRVSPPAVSGGSQVRSPSGSVRGVPSVGCRSYDCFPLFPLILEFGSHF